MKNTYSEMKDSGVAWIGKIPNHWLAHKAKVYIKITNGSDPETEGDIPVYGSGANCFKTCGEYKEGPAVLVGRKGSIDRPRYLEGRYWNVDTAFDVKTICNFSLRLYYYLALCFDYQYYVSQTTLPSMTQTNYRNMFIPIPSLPEQTAIAAYLDEKCGTIDEIIAEAKASIEEYKAWKSSVIFEAVTKGLDPHAEMKDSGVEWIGKISKCFQLKKIKSVANIYGRIGFRGYTTEDLVDEGEGAITLSPSNIADGKMNCNKCSYVSWEKYNESPEIMIFNDDVLMVKTGASYGKVAMVENLPNKATINPQLIVFKNIIINRRYFCYVMQTVAIQNQIEGIVSGGTIPTMSQNKLGNLFLLVPNDKLQEKIADYLDAKCAVIDGIIAEKEALIADMEAYKKSLIFETVTGKIKVC